MHWFSRQASEAHPGVALARMSTQPLLEGVRARQWNRQNRSPNRGTMGRQEAEVDLPTSSRSCTLCAAHLLRFKMGCLSNSFRPLLLPPTPTQTSHLQASEHITLTAYYRFDEFRIILLPAATHSTQIAMQEPWSTRQQRWLADRWISDYDQAHATAASTFCIFLKNFATWSTTSYYPTAIPRHSNSPGRLSAAMATEPPRP